MTKRVVFLLIIGLISAAALAGQVPTARDETFDLNISEKRYVETGFVRSTSATLQQGKLFFEAGTSATAGSIVMTVRGATGTVRFKARLDALERLFRGH